MMEAVFIKILNMSVTAGIIIIAVILIRFLLRRVPKIFSYTLWLAVLFRLLCPVTFSSNLSVLRLFQAPVPDQEEVSYFSDTVYSSGVTETSEAVFIKAPADSVPFVCGFEELLIRVPILSVNATNIEIELSVQETQLFLSEQESGFTYASVPPAE